MNHKQVLIQVRAMVDEGIVELVKLLNQIPDVFTISSCEGDDSIRAYVIFIMSEVHPIKAFSLLQALTSILNDVPDVEVQLKWKYGGPSFYLVLPHARIKDASKRLKDEIKVFTAKKDLAKA